MLILNIYLCILLWFKSEIILYRHENIHCKVCLLKWTVSNHGLLSLIPSVQNEWSSWNDNGYHQRLADHFFLHVPAGVGSALSREVCPRLPTQQVRVVRQVQVVIWVAAGGPGSRRQGKQQSSFCFFLSPTFHHFLLIASAAISQTSKVLGHVVAPVIWFCRTCCCLEQQLQDVVRPTVSETQTRDGRKRRGRPKTVAKLTHSARVPFGSIHPLVFVSEQTQHTTITIRWPSWPWYQLSRDTGGLHLDVKMWPIKPVTRIVARGSGRNLETVL